MAEFMKGTSSTKDRSSSGLGPRRLIFVVVCTLCLGLLGSALFTFTTLLRLRTYYLSNRGHAIAEAIEAQARGPGRRNNPSFWQSLLDASYANYSDSVAFLALVDRDNHILAFKGGSSLEPSKIGKTYSRDIYDFEETLPRPRNPRGEASPAVADWRIRIGLYSSDADFIRRQAFLQLALSCVAIVTLFVLAAYLLRTLGRFMELKAREGAEAQLKSLGVMAASLAHEIRNPLGAIKGLTQLAQEDLPSDHASQTQLSTVVNEAERLERLVTDLLDFARPKEPKVSEFNLIDLLADVRTVLQPKLEASEVTLQLPMDSGPVMIQSDPRGLRQVLLNVIINAVDASPVNSVVVLQIVRNQNDRSMVIQVEDAGPGLGESDPEEFFRPFVTTKMRGTGLGLAISRQIVEGLGGSLTLGNNPQGGARCLIQLPLRDEKIGGKIYRSSKARKGAP
jgi:signal transduction histidine kinase